MSIDVKIPEIGESITEGLLVEWNQSDGATVAAEDPLLVLETDKITMTVNAEASGRLEILVAEGETVEVGQIVARLHDDVGSGKTTEAAAGDEKQVGASDDANGDAAPASAHPLSPAVRRLVDEHGLDPSAIAGSGKDGRLVKSDVLAHLAEKETEDATRRDTPEEKPAAEHTIAETRAQRSTPSSPSPARVGAATAGERQTRAPMSRLRQRLAERLVGIQQQAAILTTFNEVDMSRVMDLRTRYKESFKQRHGVGLGFMSFFVKAVVDALKTVPAVNAFIDDSDIVSNHYYDIGIAVSSDKGLVVPVVRDADILSVAEIESAIADLARRARERTLELSDLSGGVFTISNGGIFGSMLSTPILNPPQSAILGMHAIKKRAVVVEDQIVIRPMMYLALSYDHRLIDGSEAVTFLKRVVDCLENPERLILEV